MSKITIYEGNSALITCAVYNPDGTDAVLTGFTGTLTVKTNKADVASLLTETGVNSSNDIAFTISAADNDLVKGTYFYEVTVESTTQKITIAQDRLIVKESIVYIS